MRAAIINSISAESPVKLILDFIRKFLDAPARNSFASSKRMMMLIGLNVTP
jgi:hypothetical protein